MFRLIDYQERPCLPNENNRHNQEHRSDEKALQHGWNDSI
jgi:hypothetical protein